MKMKDMVVVRELMRSVYVTGEQREALGRLLERVSPKPFVEVRLTGGPVLARVGGEPESAIEEDRRHALLGPCGAE
jgi:hypothetical protein